ncbi:hypothetical protein D9757_006849 [Collybiopsis confluens]|uniref:Uncharacterized protein n=1 Tax=Collybiopsis confluens TaxID=2823264 RepID=A0A8H5HPQ0_9AGAR|nr:hypothetical protein D9757_006849 [Collybiopsis confluens]
MSVQQQQVVDGFEHNQGGAQHATSDIFFPPSSFTPAEATSLPHVATATEPEPEAESDHSVHSQSSSSSDSHPPFTSSGSGDTAGNDGSPVLPEPEFSSLSSSISSAISSSTSGSSLALASSGSAGLGSGIAAGLALALGSESESPLSPPRPATAISPRNTVFISSPLNPSSTSSSPTPPPPPLASAPPRPPSALTLNASNEHTQARQTHGGFGYGFRNTVRLPSEEIRVLSRSVSGSGLSMLNPQHQSQPPTPSLASTPVPQRGSMILYRIVSPPTRTPVTPADSGSRTPSGLPLDPPRAPAFRGKGTTNGSPASSTMSSRRSSMTFSLGFSLTEDSKYPEPLRHGIESGMGFGTGFGGTDGGVSSQQLIAYAYEPSILGSSPSDSNSDLSDIDSDYSDSDNDTDLDAEKPKPKPKPKRERKRSSRSSTASRLSPRLPPSATKAFRIRLINIFTLFILVLALLALFIAYPVSIYTKHHSETQLIAENPLINSTGQAFVRKSDIFSSERR